MSIIDDLRTEADLCRNETAVDIANLLDKAADVIERLHKSHQRYETARRMNTSQWAEARNLNISTGKPFDEIIDDLRPFMVPNK